MGHDGREPRVNAEHEATVQVSLWNRNELVVHNTTRVTPMEDVSASNTSATMHKRNMHECTSYMSFHCCQHIGQPFSYFWHNVLSLVASRYYRTMLESVYLQKLD